MSDLDEQLANAYQDSKQQHAPPSRIKRYVNSAAQKHGAANKLAFNRDTLTMVAASFVLVVLIGVYKIANLENNTPAPIVVDVSIEVHAYAQEQIAFNVNQYRDKLTAYQASYTQRLTHQDVYSTRLATIEQVNGQWTLSDCNNVNIQISDRLVADLRTLNRVSPGLTVGDQVELALSRDGLILGITSSTAPMTC